LSVAYLLLNAASYDGGMLQADAYRPSAGHVLGFMSIGVVVTKIMTFFQFFGHFCCLYHLAGWQRARPLAAWLHRRLLLWRCRRPAHCRSL